MSHQNHFVYVKHIQKLSQIFCQCIWFITCLRIIRISMTATIKCKHVKSICKARGKLFEDICRTSHSCDEQKCRSITIPIKIMQTDAIHIYEIAFA